jgi:hypothetical protein
MNMQDHILTALKEQFDLWEELLASLSAEQITTPLLPSEWSVKDGMAHLMAWQQRTIARMEAALSNREPVFPVWLAEFDPDGEGSIDQTNDWIYKAYREQPWAQVHASWRQTYLHLVELARAVSERDLLDASKYSWMEERPLALILLSTYDHHQEHREKLIVWLEQNGK